MNSFYGGQKGTSFNLVTTYTSKEAMVADFETSTCIVGYGEYVIISNGSSNENGDIYKRTNNLLIDGGAEYVGNITGPQGASATIRVVDFNTISSEEAGIETGSMTEDNDSFVPGYDSTTSTYNDTINYKMRQSEIGNTIQTELGLQFPYPVIEFTSVISTSAKEASIERISSPDNELHPFHYKYQLTLPKSLKQNNIISIQLQKVKTGDEIYKQNTTTLIDSSYIGKSILTYTMNISTDNSSIDRVYYLCDWPAIEDITLDATTDTLTFIYGDRQSEVQLKNLKGLTVDNLGFIRAEYSNTAGSTIINQDNPLRWITATSYDNTNKKFQITYNTKSDGENYDTELIPFTITGMDYVSDVTYENGEILVTTKDSDGVAHTIPYQLLDIETYLTDIDITSNGQIRHHYSDGTIEINTNEPTLKWIKEVTYNETTGKVEVTYNDDTSTDISRAMNSIVSATRQGNNLVINYSDKDPDIIEDVFADIPSIEFVFDSEAGKLKIIMDGETTELGTIRYVDNMRMTSGGEIQIHYQNQISTAYTTIGTLNNITALRISEENKNLQVQYNNVNTWYDIPGAIQITNNLKIGLDIDYGGNTTDANIISYLKTKYPNGYQNNEDMCVVVGTGSYKKVYMFGNYETVDDEGNVIESSTEKTWRVLGNWGKELDAVAASSSTDPRVQNLPTGGLWFVTEEE